LALGAVLSAALLLLSVPSVAAAAEAPCPNDQFRPSLGALLPDCRAYEQASPTEKNGSAVEGYPSLFSAAEDGSAITWFTNSATAPSAPGGSTGWYPEYLSRRDLSGWNSQRVTAPQLPTAPNASVQSTAYLGLSPDGHYAVASARQANCDGQECGSLWLIDTQTTQATRIALATGVARLTRFALDGISTDGTKVIFESPGRILPEAIQGVSNVYMWDAATDGLSLVGTLTGETPATPPNGTFGGAYNWPENEFEAGGAMNGMAVVAEHAMSPSGDQMFFTAPEAEYEPGQPEFSQLYLRYGLAGPDPSTARISKPNPGSVDVEADGKPAAFQEATRDGAHAFFLSSAKLTGDATTGPADEGKDLYRWDRSSGELIDIAPDAKDENGAQVVGLLGASDSGTAGFFVAKGVLAPGGVAGGENIYRFEEEPTGRIALRFVAVLNSESVVDQKNWAPRIMSPYAGESFYSAGTYRASRVDRTADTLLFTSVNELTPFHNAGGKCGYSYSRPHNELGELLCAELYRYSVSNPTVTCVSCNPTGRIVGADAELQPESVGGGQIPEQGAQSDYPRNLSVDGDRVFFETTEALLPSDVNGGQNCYEPELAGGAVPCLDVYEWEASGEGSCRMGSVSYVPQNAGCLYLISPGQSPAKANQSSSFLDASATGDDVFFATNNPLVPTDIDEAFDVYDASVGGGLAAQHPTPNRICTAEECAGAVTPPPLAVTPSTSLTVGPGNSRSNRHANRCKKAGRGHHCHKGQKAPKKKPRHEKKANKGKRAGRNLGQSGWKADVNGGTR
jgi:hypothetical protein